MPGVVYLAGESHERAGVGVAVFGDVAVDGLLVPDGMKARAGHDHRLALAADLVAGVLAEVLDDDLGLLGDVVRVQRDEPGDRAARSSLLVDGVVGDRLADLPVRLVGRVVGQHVEDEALLDGLAHRVEVEGRPVAVGVLAAE